MTHGSLCAGIGGFDLGFEQAGFSTLWQVEIDEQCRRILERQFPYAERYGDIEQCRNLPHVEVITAGLPCQPHSSAARGRVKGTADPRFLWPQMRRIISESKPSWVCVENVVNFDRLALEQVVSEMEADGYEVGPPLEIPACAVGQDRWRPRLWILGYSDSNSKSGCSFNAEASRLQGNRRISASMATKDGISARLAYQMYGNAIVPEIAERLALAIRAARPTEGEGK